MLLNTTTNNANARFQTQPMQYKNKTLGQKQSKSINLQEIEARAACAGDSQAKTVLCKPLFPVLFRTPKFRVC